MPKPADSSTPTLLDPTKVVSPLPSAPTAWVALRVEALHGGSGERQTRAANVSGIGVCLHSVTQQRNPDGSYAVSEALCFVPGAKAEPVLSGDEVVAGYRLVAL